METENPDVKSGRLAKADYARNFCDLNLPLDSKTASIESSRCYFCYDAPCIEACPTEINIPQFIKRIHSGDIRGAAVTILNSNILGGTCSRVCPVEVLCEEACVRNSAEEKPVTIGALQRFATDRLFESGEQPFARATSTGKKIAVVGAGPAGLSCAHRLATLGHEVEIFESRPKSGGLNEYGIAAYKMTNDFAQKEVEFILSLGGIKVHQGQTLGSNLKLSDLRKKFDAVFLAVGLTGVNALGTEGETLPQVRNAVEFIAELRQANDLSNLAIGRKVVVIGGGNTAIDAAIQSKRLGAEEVTLVYRRGPEQMSATRHEQELAQTNGVVIRHWAKPVKIEGGPKGVTSIVFERTKLDGKGKLLGTGESFKLQVDQVFKAVGQIFVPSALGKDAESLEIQN